MTDPTKAFWRRTAQAFAFVAVGVFGFMLILPAARFMRTGVLDWEYVGRIALGAIALALFVALVPPRTQRQIDDWAREEGPAKPHSALASEPHPAPKENAKVHRRRAARVFAFASSAVFGVYLLLPIAIFIRTGVFNWAQVGRSALGAIAVGLVIALLPLIYGDDADQEKN